MLVKTYEHFDRVLVLAQNSNNNSVINTMLENMARLYEEMKKIDLAIKFYNDKIKRLDLRNKKEYLSNIRKSMYNIYGNKAV